MRKENPVISGLVLEGLGYLIRREAKEPAHSDGGGVTI